MDTLEQGRSNSVGAHESRLNVRDAFDLRLNTLLTEGKVGSLIDRGTGMQLKSCGAAAVQLQVC